MFTDLTNLTEAPSGVNIENVQPVVDAGRYAIKRVPGERVDLTADIFREGHDLIDAYIQVRERGQDDWREIRLTRGENDVWFGSFTVSVVGPAEYRVFAYPDIFQSWRHEVEKKVEAGVDIASELIEGRHIVEETFSRASQADTERMTAILAQATVASHDQPAAAAVMLSPELDELVRRNANRAHAAIAGPYPLYVDRREARYAAWYSMFPRSAGTVPGQSATFRDVHAHLPRLQKMGFDVLYFTPIHPIGEQKRKGRNNSVVSEPGDPGVPYAIGSKDGGHMDIEQTLGTWDDFDELVAAAAGHGIEIALDLAIQASPDHPWVKAHPEWFFIRPDGSIKYAENPPKKYEDIYPLNFNSVHWRELYLELYDTMMCWIGHGVKTIRVDNPHTKPVAFWEWLIAKVHETNPEVIFLSEAFTRPKVMNALAKAGFAQSYTYFTWRNFKHELIEYGTELTQTDMKEFFRGNFFTNTHDINPYILQQGGEPAFKFRVVLAATMSSVYGIYSGFELLENEPQPGMETYLNSEKYEFKVRDWDQPGNISDYIGRLNTIRREHPALHEYTNLRFFEVQNDNIIGYYKQTEDHEDIVIVLCNLNPYETQEAWFRVPLEEMGIAYDQQLTVIDVLNGGTFSWVGDWHHYRLDPHVNPAVILTITPWATVQVVDWSI